MSSKSEKKKKPKTYKYPDMTTIAITKVHAAALNEMKRNYDESYDDILKRLFANQVDVWVDFLLIDNELPQLHTVVFQLGDDKNSIYYWDGNKLERSNLEFANNLLKQLPVYPKPFMPISRRQAVFIQHLLGQPLEIRTEDVMVDTEIDLQIRKFLENTK